MSDARSEMIRALKGVVVPLLRGRGFTGSFPHLRRFGNNRIDLLTFQFDRYGGGFVIELGRCDPGGFTTHWGKQIPANKVTPWDLATSCRARIHHRSGSGADIWFRYDGADTPEAFTAVAESVVPFLQQAEEMFDGLDKAEKLG